MTLPTDYVDGDVLTAADVNAITTAVNSNTDLKVAVGTFNAKGDLLVGLTNDSVGVLTAGTNGYLLSASSGATSGLAWVPDTNDVLQYDYTVVGTQYTTNSTTVTNSGVSMSYTPTNASNNLIVEAVFFGGFNGAGGVSDQVRNCYFQLYDETNTTVLEEKRVLYSTSTPVTEPDTVAVPVVLKTVIGATNTTSRTYRIRFYSQSSSYSAIIGDASSDTVLSVTEVAP